MLRDHQTLVLTDNSIVRAGYITFIDISRIEEQRAIVYTAYGDKLEVTGFAALELVWKLKPSALEGKRLRWPKYSWAVHNLVAHPVLQLLAFFGLTKWGMWIHDATVPRPSHE